MDRRRASRRHAAETGAPLIVRLRSGPEIAVIDVSPYGLRGQTVERLCPGARVGIHVFGEAGRVFTRGAVVWSRVDALHPDGLRFEVAIALDAPLGIRERG